MSETYKLSNLSLFVGSKNFGNFYHTHTKNFIMIKLVRFFLYLSLK